MALAKLKTYKEKLYTVDEYLRMERKSLERHEFIDGKIFLKESGSGNHSDICTNLIGEIHLQVKRQNYYLRAISSRVKIGDSTPKAGQSVMGMFFYPDLVIICGKVKYYGKKKDNILNPKVIIEILSESTGDFDRGEKFMRYRMFNETLTDYILVSQDKPQVEHFIRQEDNGWKVFTFIGTNKVFRVESIECELKLAEIYDRIVFSKKALNFLKEIESINGRL